MRIEKYWTLQFTNLLSNKRLLTGFNYSWNVWNKKKVPERWSQNWRGRGQDPKRRLWQQRRRGAQATQSCRLWVCSNPPAPTGTLRTFPTTPFCNEPQQPARLRATRELDAEAEERSKRKGFWEQEKWDNFGLVNLVRLERGRIQSKQRIRKQIDTWLVVWWRGQRCNVSIKSKCGVFFFLCSSV